MVAVRIHAGPFALSFVEFGSDRQKDLLVPSVILAENGNKLVGTRRAEASTRDDWVQVRKLYADELNGATTSHLNDRVTGVEVTVHSPVRKKAWKFVVTHKNIGFEYVLTEGVGGTAYSGTVEGGLLGSEKSYSGPAFTEIMKFPEKSWLLTKNFAE
jgi:hypothetical protein